jgi:hypothetical protein
MMSPSLLRKFINKLNGVKLDSCEVEWGIVAQWQGEVGHLRRACNALRPLSRTEAKSDPDCTWEKRTRDSILPDGTQSNADSCEFDASQIVGCTFVASGRPRLH